MSEKKKAAKAPKVAELVKKLAKCDLNELHAELEKQAGNVRTMAADPSTAAAVLARNPQMENTIRQGIQSGLFFAALAARYTATTEDDKAVARALAVTMDPEKWKVIADLIWGA